MSLQVVFLGTAGSVPTPTRSLPAIAVRRKGELMLFDCGEGVQRQMMKAGLGFGRKMKVFITHMHGDHVFGLPGLIQTMSLLHRVKKLEVYGPRGLDDFIEAVENTVHSTATFPLETSEMQHGGLVCEESEYKIFTALADHIDPSLAYSLVESPRPGRFHPERARSLGVPEGELWSTLQHGSAVRLSNGRAVNPKEVMGPQRPGRKIVYTGDCRPSDSVVKLAEGADLLIHDCTFDDELTERAKEDGHSTPSQAAETAQMANVKELILTHISARYKTSELLVEQARRRFEVVRAAEDFMKINLPIPSAR